MRRLGQNTVISMVLILCAFVQLIAIQPHHHHDGNDTPCLYLFCSSQEDFTEGCDDHSGHCCHNHSGDDGDFGGGHSPMIPCTALTHYFVATQPNSDQIEVVAKSIVAKNSESFIATLNLRRFIIADYHTDRSNGLLDRQPNVISPLIEYISDVLSSRAPDSEC